MTLNINLTIEQWKPDTEPDYVTRLAITGHSTTYGTVEIVEHLDGDDARTVLATLVDELDNHDADWPTKTSPALTFPNPANRAKAHLAFMHTAAEQLTYTELVRLRSDLDAFNSRLGALMEAAEHLEQSEARALEDDERSAA